MSDINESGYFGPEDCGPVFCNLDAVTAERRVVELEAENQRLRDHLQRVTDAVVDWRKQVTGDIGSGCPIDAVVVLAARLRKAEADNDRLYAAIRDILASPPAGVSNAVVSEVERLP